MRTFIVLALALTGSACTREEKLVDRFVEKYCEARWACGCDSPGLTQVHCESMLTMAGDEAQAAAQDAGLEYDRECAKAWLDAVDDSCSVQPEPAGWPAAVCGQPCRPYHSNKRKGEACEEFGPWSDCARGLVCDSIPGVSSVCVDPCDGQREGDPCDHGDYVSGCVGSLVCTAEGVCGRAPAIGEACLSACAPGGMCSWDTWTCLEAPGFGEPCGEYHDACGRNLVCTWNDDDTRVCDAAPAEVCSLGAPW